MPTSRSGRSKAAAFLAAALAATAVVSDAGAFTEGQTPDCTPETYGTNVMEYAIIDNPPSPNSAAKKQEIRDGLEIWNTVDSYDNDQIVEWKEVSPILADVLIVSSNLPQGIWGESHCELDRIELDFAEIELTSGGDAYYEVTAHEAGHYMGLSHADPMGDWSNTPALMSSCLIPKGKPFDNDERAALAWNDSKTSYGADFIVSNHGFETAGVADYGKASSANFSFITNSSVAAHGERYASLSRKSGATGEVWIRQSHTFWGGLLNSTPGHSLDGRFYYFTAGPFGTQDVELELYIRGVDYVGTGPCTGAFAMAGDPSNGNPADHWGRTGSGGSGAITNWVKVRRENFGPSGSFVFAKEPSNFRLRDANESTFPPGMENWDAHDVRIKITNKGGGTLYLDTIALRDFGE